MRKLFIVLAVLILSVTACQAAPTNEIRVVARDFSYDLPLIEIRAGELVRLTLENAGALEHDLVITRIPLAGKDEHSMEHSTRGHESADADFHVSAQPDGSSYIEFTAAEPGVYAFFCSVEGHKEAGMTGTLVVK